MSGSNPVAAAPSQFAAPLDLRAGLWRRRLLIGWVGGLSLVAGLAVTFLSAPSYRAEARVLIENLETSYDRSENETVIASRVLDESELGSQVQVIASGDIGKRVLEELDFPSASELSGKLAPSGPFGRVLIALGLKGNANGQSEQQRALAIYRQALTVYPVPQSRVVAIRFTATDAKTAAAVANRVAQVYVTATREVQNDNMGRARAWLADEIERLRSKLAGAETAVEQFRIEHGLLKGTENTLAAQELSELSSQITLAETAQAELEAKARAIRGMMRDIGTVDASAPVLDSALMQRLREQQIALSREHGELSAVYLANHPKMIAVTHDLKELEQAVHDEAMKVVLSSESQAQTAAARVAALRTRFESLKAEAGQANREEVRLRALEREAAASKTVLETYMSRLTDANARGTLAAQPGVARIIEEAEVPPNPYFPKGGPIIVLSGAGGLLLGVGLAFMAMVMSPDESVRRHELPGANGPATPPSGDGATAVRTMRPKPVEQDRNGTADAANASRPLEPLCEIEPCETATQARMHVAATFARPGTGYSLAIRPMVGWVLGLRQSQAARRILVTGIGYERHEAAVVSLALGRALALKGMKTILVDTDSGSRALDLALGDRFRRTGEAGGQIPADSIMKESESGLFIFQAPLDPAALPAPAMGKILETLERSYDLVITHGSPASPANAASWDSFQIGLVVASGRYTREAATAVDMLRAGGLSDVRFIRTRDSRIQIGMKRAEGA